MPCLHFGRPASDTHSPIWSSRWRRNIDGGPRRPGVAAISARMLAFIGTVTRTVPARRHRADHRGIVERRSAGDDRPGGSPHLPQPCRSTARSATAAPRCWRGLLALRQVLFAGDHRRQAKRRCSIVVAASINVRGAPTSANFPGWVLLVCPNLASFFLVP